MTRQLIFMASVVGVFLCGCGGTESSSPAPAANPYAGTYIGSNYASDGTVGSVNVTISSSGKVSGSVNNTAKQSFTLSGTVGSTGATSITLTASTGGSVVTSGSLGFNSADDLTGTLTRTTGTTDTITVCSAKNPLEFAGNYSGTYTTTARGPGTISSLSVSTSGVIIGTAVSQSGPATAFSGNVSSNGAVSLQIAQSGGTDAETGITAFNASGQLVFVTNGVGDSATLTLGTAK